MFVVNALHAALSAEWSAFTAIISQCRLLRAVQNLLIVESLRASLDENLPAAIGRRK
jgi:hypothetical protein